jgi:uncharacterized protein
MLSPEDSLVSDRHPLVSLLYILLIVLIGFTFIGPGIGLAVSSLFYEGDLLKELFNPKLDPSIFLPLMVTQGITSLFGLILFPIAWLSLVEKKSFARFFTSERDPKIYFLLPVLGVCFLLAISPIVEWNMNFEFPDLLKDFGEWAREREDALTGITKTLTDFKSVDQFLLALLVIAILPGIGEELVFRGLIQNELFRSSKNIHAAIWVSAILFSAIHMQFFGFIPRMLLGALFGYMYYWSGNLVIPMIAHFVHNGFTLTLIYLYNLGILDIDPNSEESAPLLLVIVSAVGTFALLFFLKDHYKNQQSNKP